MQETGRALGGDRCDLSLLPLDASGRLSHEPSSRVAVAGAERL